MSRRKRWLQRTRFAMLRSPLSFGRVGRMRDSQEAG